MLIRHLAEAVANAFPTRSKFEAMLLAQLNIAAEEIPTGEDHRGAVEKTILWLESQGRLGELMRGAILENPGNPKLTSLVNDWFRLPAVAHPIVKVDPSEVVEMDSGQLLEVQRQLQRIETQMALMAQAREYSLKEMDTRNALLEKELGVLRESIRVNHTMITTLQRLHESTSEQIVAIKEWQKSITGAREMRWPAMYEQIAMAFIAFMVLGVIASIYFSVFGPPGWMGIR